MGKSTGLWGREVVLGGVAIALLAILINSDTLAGSLSKTLPESNGLNYCELIRINMTLS
jgi:hypothetical protein